MKFWNCYILEYALQKIMIKYHIFEILAVFKNIFSEFSTYLYFIGNMIK